MDGSCSGAFKSSRIFKYINENSNRKQVYFIKTVSTDVTEFEGKQQNSDECTSDYSSHLRHRQVLFQW